MRQFTVYVFDPDEAVTLGITSFLSSCSDIERLSSSTDQREALLEIADTQPDIVIVGDSLGTGDPFDTIMRLRRSANHTRLVLYCHEVSQASIEKCLQLKVQGLALRRNGLKELQEAVRTVAGRRSYFASDATDHLLQKARSAMFDACISRLGLTSTDVRIIELVATGCSNREIAEQLYLAEATVKKRLNEMFGRLEAADRTSLVMRAMQVGVL